MKHHTFLCGTSKSKKQDAYYIHHNNRFWGTLHETGITDHQIEPENYRDLGRKYGIFLTEIVDPDEYRIPSDSDIEPRHLADGMEKLITRIQEHQPKRIAFVGKNAATWFYRYCEQKQLTHSQASPHTSDRRNLSGFELNWNYYGLDYYLLSNTHRHWDSEVWRDFWDIVKEDVNAYRVE